VIVVPTNLDGRAEARSALAPPAWETALLDLLHPTQIAIAEACLWIEEPLSATLLAEVFEHDFKLNLIAYHVRRLSDRGVLREVASRTVRGAIEHFYLLATEPRPSAAQTYPTAGNGLGR
jgi:hypothetical protein